MGSWTIPTSTWSSAGKENCRKLTVAHQQCEEWARENGAKFEPSKYQLIHFTRCRRHAREDLASSVQIGVHQVVPQEKEIRVLGVWLDPALSWKEHLAQAARKGNAASEALSRLATSTWGPQYETPLHSSSPADSTLWVAGVEHALRRQAASEEDYGTNSPNTKYVPTEANRGIYANAKSSARTRI